MFCYNKPVCNRPVARYKRRPYHSGPYKKVSILRFLFDNTKGKRRAARFALSLLAAFLLVLAAFDGPSRADNNGPYSTDKPYYTDIGQFNYANFLMHERDFHLAVREFARLIEHFPASPLLPRAQWHMAEAFYHAGRLHDAEAELKLFISNFEESPFAEQARVRLDEVRRKLWRESAPVSPSPGIYRKPFIPAAPPLRAVQVMLFEGRNKAEIGGELARLKAAGVDTVIVRAFHNPGDRYYRSVKSTVRQGVYFKTSNAPVVEDILGEFTALAHSNGLKIFAWMTTRYADYGVEDDPALACKKYDLESGDFVRCRGLDLFNPAAIERLEAIYSDLAAYDIDGILFQDDLVLRHTEGFGPFMSALFAAETGHSAHPDALYGRTADGRLYYTELFWEWASWKNRRLLTVADRLRTAVREKRPEVRFAINLMYESVTNPPYALAWLSQNLDAAVRSDFDYYSIMAYHRQMSAELDKDPAAIRAMIGRMVTDASTAVSDPGSVLIKLQTIDWTTGKALSDSEVVGLLKQVKSTGAVSVAVVPYRGDFPFYELGSKDIALLNRP